MQTTFKQKGNTTEVHAYGDWIIKDLLEEFGEESFDVVRENGTITELHAENLEDFEIVFGTES